MTIHINDNGVPGCGLPEFTPMGAERDMVDANELEQVDCGNCKKTLAYESALRRQTPKYHGTPAWEDYMVSAIELGGATDYCPKCGEAAEGKNGSYDKASHTLDMGCTHCDAEWLLIYDLAAVEVLND